MTGTNGLLVNSLARGFIESNAVAGANEAGATRVEVATQVVGGKDAIAVGEKQIRRRGGANAGVPAAGELKSVVWMSAEFDRKVHFVAEVGDNLGGFVTRAVVNHNYFKLSGDALLRGKRQQAAP
jgi:hypothetical protein